jgi:hypothetical protein
MAVPTLRSVQPQVNVVGSPDKFNGGILDIHETKSVVKTGLNFRFGGWSEYPVAARY